MENETDFIEEHELEEELPEVEEEFVEEESKKSRFVALKVIGIVAGIIAVIALAAYLVVNTPQVKYRLSAHYASQGRYIEARDELHSIRDYKDSDRKYDEYALIICKQYYAVKDYDEALKWAEWTSSSTYEDICIEANSLISEIQQQKALAEADKSEGLVQPAN